MEAAAQPEKHIVEALLPFGGQARIEPLGGDGSARRYFRVFSGSESFILLFGTDREEDAAWLRINAHLSRKGVRVPQVYGSDLGRGLVLMEDLGDENLLGELRRAGNENAEALYLPVIDLLLKAQIEGAEDFTLSTGFSESPYDKAVMVQTEGKYFVESFAGFMTGMKAGDGVFRDIEKMADEGAKAKGGYFLHRDFQSRNIHLKNGQWVIIDFQGARPGPLAYDAAALILDPYAGLPLKTRKRLFALYLEKASLMGADGKNLAASWRPIGSMRLMQALGAFGKLGGKLGKKGFLEYAGTALGHLSELLGEEGAHDYPDLFAFVEETKFRWLSRPA